LKRVVDFGDGWHIGLLGLEAIEPKFAQLRALMADAGRDFSQLEITSMVENRTLSAPDIRAYRDLGVTGLYVVAPPPDPKRVLSLMREFTKKVQDAVG
jgi:hypothetical protein